jgi:nucleoside-diphosphate-sugar epimerase
MHGLGRRVRVTRPQSGQDRFMLLAGQIHVVGIMNGAFRPYVYALAKDLEEEMARQFCRWNPQQKMIGLRFSNVMEPSDYADFPTFEADPASRKWNLWTYIDVRDGAQAVLRALAFEQPGFDNFIIANPDSVMSRPSTELMAEFFPGTEFRAPVEGTDSLCSIEKARRILGWQPQHSWRNHTSA